jgi:hypothetical protein
VIVAQNVQGWQVTLQYSYDGACLSLTEVDAIPVGTCLPQGNSMSSLSHFIGLDPQGNATIGVTSFTSSMACNISTNHYGPFNNTLPVNDGPCIPSTYYDGSKISSKSYFLIGSSFPVASFASAGTLTTYQLSSCQGPITKYIISTSSNGQCIRGKGLSENTSSIMTCSGSGAGFSYTSNQFSYSPQCSGSPNTITQTTYTQQCIVPAETLKNPSSPFVSVSCLSAQGSQGLSSGIVAAIVVPLLLCFGCLGGGFYYWYTKKISAAGQAGGTVTPDAQKPPAAKRGSTFFGSNPIPSASSKATAAAASSPETFNPAAEQSSGFHASSRASASDTSASAESVNNSV